MATSGVPAQAVSFAKVVQAAKKLGYEISYTYEADVSLLSKEDTTSEMEKNIKKEVGKLSTTVSVVLDGANKSHTRITIGKV